MSNIDEEKDADIAEIQRHVDLTQFNDLIDATSLQDSNWKETLRQQKKKLSEKTKKQMDDLQSGVTTWAKFAASLSRTMGFDAPMIAGFLLLTNKMIHSVPNLYKQIREYDGESGEVANQFIERNYTDATIEELEELSDDRMITN